MADKVQCAKSQNRQERLRLEQQPRPLYMIPIFLPHPDPQGRLDCHASLFLFHSIMSIVYIFFRETAGCCSGGKEGRKDEFRGRYIYILLHESCEDSSRDV